MYGTTVKGVHQITEQGRTCILDIDMQGVKSVKALPAPGLNARFIFIQPPTVDALEKRLRGRGTETEESLSKRLAAATEELAWAQTPNAHDIIIVNDELEAAYDQLKAYILYDEVRLSSCMDAV